MFASLWARARRASSTSQQRAERILNIADRIIVLADGRVQNDGPREDVLPTLLGGTPGVCEALADKVR